MHVWGVKNIFLNNRNKIDVPVLGMVTYALPKIVLLYQLK